MSAPRRVRPAVFLDRDGPLNRELERAPTRPGELELLAGALAGVARLAQAGFALVVLTNQSAIARGALEFEQLAAVHAELARLLAEAGAALAGIYVCPHHPEQGQAPYRRACSCRKPASGLLERAAFELDLDLAHSWVVGDAERDLAAGECLGIPGVLVLTGKGPAELARLTAAGRAPEHVAAGLAEAAELILGRVPPWQGQGK